MKNKLSDDNQDQSVDEDPWKKPFKIWKKKDGKGWKVPKWMVESKDDEHTIKDKPKKPKRVSNKTSHKEGHEVIYFNMRTKT